VSVSALMRARNEVAGMGALLDRLQARTVPVEVVVIDSGSTDGTFEAVRARGVEPLTIAAGGPHARRSALRARLDPRPAAMVAGKWPALR
jgi:glycosyltransferase involved in cell wall biosynthesis